MRYDGFSALFSPSHIETGGRQFVRLVHHSGANGRVYRYFEIIHNEEQPIHFLTGGAIFSNLRDVKDFPDGLIVSRSSMLHLLPSGSSVTETHYSLSSSRILKEREDLIFFPTPMALHESPMDPAPDCPTDGYQINQEDRKLQRSICLMFASP